MLDKEPNTTRTLQVLALTLAAVVGSIAGSATMYVLVSQVGLPSFSSGQNLSDQEVDSRVVELLEDEQATISVVERVTPAVVSIVVKKEMQRPAVSYRSPFFPLEISEDQEVETQLVEVSSGTGFFVTEDGYLLTNKHVIDEEGAQYMVVTNNGEEFAAELIATDPFEDVAIMKVATEEGQTFDVVNLGDSDQIKIGQTVIAVGNTLSEFRNTVTKGVISGIDRQVLAGDAFNAEVLDEAIQTDAAINPGNSGGPLINLLGQVIGINTAISRQGESIAFAIPINIAKRAVDDVLEHGRIVRPWLGVRYVLVEPADNGDDPEQYEIGALVVPGQENGEVAVFENSPADKAGIQEGDIIIAVEDEEFSAQKGLGEVVSQYRPGEVITIRILRDEEIQEVEVTLEEYQNS